MNVKIYVLMVSIIILLAAPAMAQFVQDEDDLGVADTVDVEFTVVPDYSTGTSQFRVDVFVFDDSNQILGHSMGFVWDNPNIQMDSAFSGPEITAAYNVGPFLFEDNSITTTNAHLRFLHGGLTFGAGYAPQPNRVLWASYFFTASSWDICDSIALDSLSFNSASTYQFTTLTDTYNPYFTGRVLYRDTACVQLANLVTSVDTLYFNAIEGQGSPTTQSFTVSSDAQPISFNLVETIPWIAVSPTGGVTTQAINVIPSTSSLAQGSYLDSIRVQSTEASNSPLYVFIDLQVAPPPPIIGYDPPAFYFNAVAGEANPDDKFLNISNIGGQVLNWTVSNSTSWLSLSPISGTNSGVVTLSVDITGLAYDDYKDTVVITDPTASNNPIKIPVNLSVGSDLPIIEVDSAFNFIPVPTAKLAVPPRKILIRNGGAGILNYTLTESSNRLFTYIPVSGTAPQEVEVTFKITYGNNGDDYFDTLWVHSNEAINSPFPVVFHFHFVDYPSQMYITTDTARVTVYECTNGYQVPAPSVQFVVDNVGGDDPMPFTLLWESEFVKVESITSTAPSVITVVSKDLDYPVGVWYDTLLFYAPTSIVRWDTVIVEYSVIEGIEPPEIVLSKYNYVFTAQENTGESKPASLVIDNVHGGCYEWFIAEEVPWMFPEDTNDFVDSRVTLGINSDGFYFGEYPDVFQVTSPEAINSPVQVNVLFRVWKLHGDFDYNGTINIVDLVGMVNYLLKSGPPPQPEYYVGDINCDLTINIADLTYLVDYLLKSGPIPCGNPY
ncbi:MAG: dockerin type I domain-containing protein [bacterium]